MDWESFGVVKFDLGPLLQGQTRRAKLKSRPGQNVFVFISIQIHFKSIHIHIQILL